MIQTRYPVSAIRGDALRATLGLILTIGPLALFPTASLVFWICTGSAALFGLFGLQTALRYQHGYRVSETGLERTGVMPVRLHWHDVNRMKLHFYATRRDRSEGWLRLYLSGKPGRVGLDSTLPDFDRIIAIVMELAPRDLKLDPNTRLNLMALGYDYDALKSSAAPDTDQSTGPRIRDRTDPKPGSG